MCASLGAIALIDDHPKHVGLCVEAGLKVCVFDQPWNQKINHVNLIRVTGWKEALEEIKKLKSTSK